MVGLQQKRIYKETIIGSSAQSERERNARNVQQMMKWQNKCQSFFEVVIMCGDKPWPLANRETVSLLYLSIGVEWRRILNCKNPHINVDTLTTADGRGRNHQTRNITFDRHVFLTMQLREKQSNIFTVNLKIGRKL